MPANLLFNWRPNPAFCMDMLLLTKLKKKKKHSKSKQLVKSNKNKKKRKFTLVRYSSHYAQLNHKLNHGAEFHCLQRQTDAKNNT